MRARQLKPEFFTDRKIAAMGPVPALVYQALWVSADDGGVAHCDPDRMKGEMFWAWPSISTDDIAGALRQLEEQGRIHPYVVGDDRFAELPTFSRHQFPHNPSKFRFPRPDAPTSPADTGASADDDGRTDDDYGRATAGLPQEGGRTRIPYPLSLIPSPESHTPVSMSEHAGRADTRDGDAVECDGDFDAVWAAYPRRSGGNGKADALSAYRARRREGVPHAELLAGVERYARYCDATEKTGTEYVKQARTFLGKGRHYAETWEIPQDRPAARSASGTGAHRSRFAPASQQIHDTIAAMAAKEHTP